MRKKKMILADNDERYLKEISYYFMEHVPQFELIIFTEKEKLYQYIGQGNKAEALVVDESLAEEKLKEQTPGMTRIVLSVGTAPVDGFEMVKKYQRMEALSNQILLKYAEANNTLETVRGNNRTRIAAFYSPAGGTGKTTLCLAMATAASKAGVHTLYLNLEEIDSVKGLFGRTAGSLSDVFLALKTKGMHVGIKIKGCVGTEPTAGFVYLPGVESVSEYEEIGSGEIEQLMKTIRELADYELVLIDLSSGFTGNTRAILKEADTIFVPVLAEEGSLSKLNRLLEESGLHDLYDPLFRKMVLVLNRVDRYGKGIRNVTEQLRGRLPCCAGIAEASALSEKSKILCSGDSMLQFMEPMIRAVMQEAKGGRGDTEEQNG